MNDKDFMRLAINDAKSTGHHFGALIVRKGRVIAKPLKRHKGDARFHAETKAILNACKKLKTKDLRGCTLYSTCEPCPMCFYMAWITGISKIVYGTTLQDSLNAGFPEINVSVNFLNRKSGNKIKLKGKVLRKEILAGLFSLTK